MRREASGRGGREVPAPAPRPAPPLPGRPERPGLAQPALLVPRAGVVARRLVSLLSAHRRAPCRASRGLGPGRGREHRLSTHFIETGPLTQEKGKTK